MFLSRSPGFHMRKLQVTDSPRGREHLENFPEIDERKVENFEKLRSAYTATPLNIHLSNHTDL